MSERSASLVPAAVVLVVHAGCVQVAPIVEETFKGWEGATGYFSVGVVAHQAFPGESDIAPGVGYTMTMPPLAAVSTGFFALLMCGVGAGGGDVDGSDLDAAVDWLFEGSGVSGVSDERRLLVTEVTLDFTLTQSFHPDDDGMRELTFTGAMLGARLGGPERYGISYFLVGGWGWYHFDFHGPSDASARGPYLGGGLQYYLTQKARVCVEYKRMYFTSTAGSGAPEEGAEQLNLVLSGHWYY